MPSLFSNRTAKTLRPRKNTPVGSKVSPQPRATFPLQQATPHLLHAGEVALPSAHAVCACVAPLRQGLQLKKHIEATLGRGDVRSAVALPSGTCSKALEGICTWEGEDMAAHLSGYSYVRSALALPRHACAAVLG